MAGLNRKLRRRAKRGKDSRGEKSITKDPVVERNLDPLAQFILVAPYLVGTLVASRFLLREFLAFTIGLFVVLCSGRLSVLYLRRERNPKVGKQISAFFIAITLLSIFFALETKSILAGLILLFCGLSVVYIYSTHVRKMRDVVFYIVNIAFTMSFLAFLGVFSQTQIISTDVIATLILGFVPGIILAGSMFARFATMLETLGYSRTREVIDKNGGKILRPGLLSAVFSLLILLGPVALVVLSLPPFHVLPILFIIPAAVLFFVPHTAKAFQDRTKSDKAISEQVLVESGVVLLLLFIIGMLVSST